jgi:hypothetical protein
VIRYAAIGLIVLSLGACAATVSPWERGYLAKPEMAFEPYPVEAAFREHIFFSREGAWGGYAVGGGGCGCN